MLDTKAVNATSRDAALFNHSRFQWWRADTSVKCSKSVVPVCINLFLKGGWTFDWLATIEERVNKWTNMWIRTLSDLVSGGAERWAISTIAWSMGKSSGFSCSKHVSFPLSKMLGDTCLSPLDELQWWGSKICSSDSCTNVFSFLAQSPLSSGWVASAAVKSDWAWEWTGRMLRARQ